MLKNADRQEHPGPTGSAIARSIERRDEKATRRNASRRAALRMLLIVAAAVFAVEMTIMLVLFRNDPFEFKLSHALLDSFGLSLAVCPILFLTVYRPIAALADERARSQRAAEEALSLATHQLSALCDVTAVASASLDLERILQRSLDRILTVMGSEMGLIRLLDDEGKALRLAATRGIPADVVAQLQEVPAGDWLEGWVMDHPGPQISPRRDTDPRVVAAALQGLAPRACVTVALRARGQVLGAAAVFRDDTQPFSAAEAALLAAIGDQLGVSVENARLFARVQVQAALEERQRLARELHDSATQTLYSLTLMAETGRRWAEAGNLEQTQGYLGRLVEIARQTLKEMRLLVYELRPLALSAQGLVGALQQRLEAVEERAGVTTQLEVDGGTDVPASLEEGLYRIAQEALNNAVKHAAARAVSIRVRIDPQEIEMQVIDDGRGFDPDVAGQTGGLGLMSMRERAELLGGSLTITSAPGLGTRVQVRLEVPRVADAAPSHEQATPLVEASR